MTGDSLAPLPTPPGQTPQQVVDAISDAAKSSFALGMKLLSRPRRQAMRAVYAYCRVVDDIADGDLPVDRKLALMAEWRDEIRRIYLGRPASAIGQALSDPIAEYSLPMDEFLLIAEGMEWDIRGPIVAPSLERLLEYSRRVAGAVGHTFACASSAPGATKPSERLRPVDLARRPATDQHPARCRGRRRHRPHLPDTRLCLDQCRHRPRPGYASRPIQSCRIARALPGRTTAVMAFRPKRASAGSTGARPPVALFPALAMIRRLPCLFPTGWTPPRWRSWPQPSEWAAWTKLRHGLAAVLSPPG